VIGSALPRTGMHEEGYARKCAEFYTFCTVLCVKETRHCQIQIFHDSSTREKKIGMVWTTTSSG